MIVSNVSRRAVRTVAVALLIAPVLGAGLTLPSVAAESAKCEGTLLACMAKEAEAGAAKLSAPPTSAPVVGETLASTSD